MNNADPHALRAPNAVAQLNVDEEDPGEVVREEQGRVRLDDLISHRMPLEEWREAFDLCTRGEGIKVLLSAR